MLFKARAHAHASDQALIVVLVNREAAARTEVVAFDPGPGERGLRFDEETLGGLECGASKKNVWGTSVIGAIVFLFRHARAEADVMCFRCNCGISAMNHLHHHWQLGTSVAQALWAEKPNSGFSVQ